MTLDQDEDLAQCCGLWERLRASAHGEGRGMPGERCVKGRGRQSCPEL